MNVNYTYFWSTSPSPKLVWYMFLNAKRSSYFFLNSFFPLFYGLLSSFYNLFMWSRDVGLSHWRALKGQGLLVPWERREKRGGEQRGCKQQRPAPSGRWDQAPDLLLHPNFWHMLRDGSEQSLDSLLLFENRKQNFLVKWLHLN